MKKLISAMAVMFAIGAQAQNTAPANVYPSNLEENMYYEKFNTQTDVIEGLTFMVLSDGDNSRDRTPAFEVALYLLPEGSTSRDDLIIVKTYKLDGIYHMGSHEFKGENIDLKTVKGLKKGNYRLGIWVNASESFDEDRSDNANLFRGTLAYSGAQAAPSKQKSMWEEDDEEEEEEESDEWEW